MESWETNERLIGSARRECLDFMIPIDERHIGRILKEWTTHYNTGRPQMSFGPGIPERRFPKVGPQVKRHEIPENHRVVATPVLSDLHHEYGLQRIAA